MKRILFESIQSAAIIIFVFFLHEEQQQKRKNCIMKTMALDDLIKNPLTEEDKRIINSAKPAVTEEYSKGSCFPIRNKNEHSFQRCQRSQDVLSFKTLLNRCLVAAHKEKK